jgi:hypothetical protein
MEPTVQRAPEGVEVGVVAASILFQILYPEWVAFPSMGEMGGTTEAGGVGEVGSSRIMIPILQLFQRSPVAEELPGVGEEVRERLEAAGAWGEDFL